MPFISNRIWHVYNRISFSHKKKEILPFVTTWMDLKGICATFLKIHVLAIVNNAALNTAVQIHFQDSDFVSFG